MFDGIFWDEEWRILVVIFAICFMLWEIIKLGVYSALVMLEERKKERGEDIDDDKLDHIIGHAVYGALMCFDKQKKEKTRKLKK